MECCKECGTESEYRLEIFRTRGDAVELTRVSYCCKNDLPNLWGNWREKTVAIDLYNGHCYKDKDSAFDRENPFGFVEGDIRNLLCSPEVESLLDFVVG